MTHLRLIMIQAWCRSGPNVQKRLMVATNEGYQWCCVCSNSGGVLVTISCVMVAWMRFETRTILTMHTRVISRNPRLKITHSGHRAYVLHIKNVQEEDRGSYMCQVNTEPMLSQIGYLDVVCK
ncbi:ig-like domain-containing protein [Trichonephila clavipes]|nr:ig-like domain-containing protein [Trichonephila clavipes]